MPYINTAITEGEILSQFGDLIKANGWTQKLTFKKAAYPNSLTSTGVLSAMKDTDKFDFAVSEHIIFQNSQGALYGVAKVYNFEEVRGKLPGTTPYTTQAAQDTFHEYLLARHKKFGKECVLYFYMLETLPADIPTNWAIPCATGITPERGSIDIEAYSGKWTGSGTLATFDYDVYKEDIMQSPFVKSTLRNSNLVLTDVATNWYPDSLVRVQGVIDNETLCVVFQADSTPAFMNNVVPSVPVYWGQFASFKENDTGNQALWAGTAFDKGTESASHSFDNKASTPFRNAADYVPVKKSYPNYPGNGIDNIIVKRSEMGARYQAYFLSWSAPPQAMPPDRVGKNGGQYPVAWNTQENDEYKYKFNPSVYSGKVHTSRIYLIHPDEGVRGYLPKLIILGPYSLVQEDKLKVRISTCPDVFEQYRYFLPSAISPISKRPGTVFTPAAIGIYEKQV